MGAGLVEAGDLALETRVGRQANGNERTAGGVRLCNSHAYVAKRAAHAPRFAFKTFLQGGERLILSRFHPIERFMQPAERGLWVGARLAAGQAGEDRGQSALEPCTAIIGGSGGGCRRCRIL